MILRFFHNRDLANAIKLLQFFGKGGDIVRRDLAQKDHQIVGALRVPIFHEKTLDLAGPETKRLSKQFGRETSAVDHNSKLTTLIS